MSISEAQKRANYKYRKEKTCQIVIQISPAQRDQINEYCKQFGGTATHIKRLLRDDMRKNGIVPIEIGNSLPTPETESGSDQTEID